VAIETFGSIFAGFGIVELFEGLGIVGQVHLLAGLVDRIDFLAAILDLDLADCETFARQLRFQRRLGLELGFRGGAATAAGGERRSSNHAGEAG
jgi:hypothetical protein